MLPSIYKAGHAFRVSVGEHQAGQPAQGVVIQAEPVNALFGLFGQGCPNQERDGYLSRSPHSDSPQPGAS